MAFRRWHGPVVGKTVSLVWQGYASVLFLEFGILRPSEYILPSGKIAQPEGEWKLTTMDSFADWELLLGCKQIATSETHHRHRERALPRLLGRRLQSFEIEATSRSSRLTFSGGLVLLTSTLHQGLHAMPHWMMRLPTSGDDDWPYVILGGTSSHWASTVAPMGQRDGFRDIPYARWVSIPTDDVINDAGPSL